MIAKSLCTFLFAICLSVITSAQGIDSEKSLIAKKLATLALTKVAKKHKIAVDQLKVTYTTMPKDLQTGRVFYSYKIISSSPNVMIYSITLDEEGQEVDLEKMIKLEREKRGKLAPDLKNKLALLKPTDSVDVSIWLKTLPINHTRYSRPTDKTISKDSINRFLKEHNRKLNAEYEANYQQYGLPFVTSLEKEGYKVKVSKDPLIIYSRLSVRKILQLALQERVDTIYQQGVASNE